MCLGLFCKKIVQFIGAQCINASFCCCKIEVVTWKQQQALLTESSGSCRPVCQIYHLLATNQSVAASFPSFYQAVNEVKHSWPYIKLKINIFPILTKFLEKLLLIEMIGSKLYTHIRVLVKGLRLQISLTSNQIVEATLSNDKPSQIYARHYYMQNIARIANAVQCHN